jgi:hypothetical protein
VVPDFVAGDRQTPTTFDGAPLRNGGGRCSSDASLLIPLPRVQSVVIARTGALGLTSNVRPRISGKELQ